MSLTETQKRIKKQAHDYCKDISKMLTEKILRLRIEVIELKPCNVLLNNTRYVYTHIRRLYMKHILLLIL